MKAWTWIFFARLVLAAFSVAPTGVAQNAPRTTPVVPAHKNVQSGAPPVVEKPSGSHALDAADLEAFFDGMIPLQLERADIAGASVLVIRDGKLLLQKGYGYSNAKDKIPVDPKSTIFRLASISKLFTWVAVMQLQEQGKVDLDTDINSYLDFKIRPAFDKPITIRNLMTHTGGFEEQTRDIILVRPKHAPSLREFLIANQPKRLFPPGEISGYSNYGVGLGSYIVERLSGEPFEQYVAEHIFTPLGMTHSTFLQPPPKELESFPSEGYRRNTQKDPVGFEIFNPVGAGGVSSTAADMGRFGQALLNGGELDGKRILRPETLAAMMTPQFRASDRMPPICMGFYENWRNDLRWIGHEGDLIAFHSMFFVERSQKVVLFVSFNSSGSSGRARPELLQMFSDRYFPWDRHQAFLQTPEEQVRALLGTYRSTRRADSTKIGLDSLMNQRTVALTKEGALEVEDVNDLRGHPIKWKPIGKNLFEEVDGQRRMFAIRDGNGQVVRLAFDFAGAQAERVRWYENGKFVLPALCTSLAVLVAVILGGSSRTVRRRVLKDRPKPLPLPHTTWLPMPTQIAAWIWVVMVGAILATFSALGDNIPPPTSGWVKYFYLVNAVTGAAIFFSVLAISSAAIAWLRTDLRGITKTKFTLVAAACLFLCWFSIHWNLIGPASRF